MSLLFTEIVLARKIYPEIASHGYTRVVRAPQFLLCTRCIQVLVSAVRGTRHSVHVHAHSSHPESNMFDPFQHPFSRLHHTLTTQGSRSYDVLLVPPKHTQTRARGTSAATKICTAEDEDPAGSQEIPGLRGSDLSPLQSFELDGTLEEDNGGIPEDLGAEDLSVHAEALKDKGNVLFKLGDTEAAAEIFSKVLRALEPPPGVGESCGGWGEHGNTFPNFQPKIARGNPPCLLRIHQR